VTIRPLTEKFSYTVSVQKGGQRSRILGCRNHSFGYKLYFLANQEAIRNSNEKFEAFFVELISTALLEQRLQHGKHTPTSFTVPISDSRINMTVTT
jgi:hypothetical protein